jgi:tetratricopeptide (TPR) repeat protein
MSETVDNTQPNKATQPVKAQKPEPAQGPETTQEVKAAPKKKFGGRIGRFFLNILIFMIIITLGIFGGYQSGIGIRQRAQRDLVGQQLNDQFSRALVDIQFGNYNAAQTRLEYILEINPSYPGALEKLTEVMVMSNMPTATPVVSPTPALIVDDSNYEALLAQAKQLVAAGQWQNALTVLDTLRAKDSSFHTVEVDGMYYFSLRNMGVDLIKAGNLEGGIYALALAERFGPLDNIAHYLRENSRFYITAASFWELDWKLASEYFYQLSGSGIWDGTMTANERYRVASIRYADQLLAEENFCEAYEQYLAAQAIGQLDAEAVGRSDQAYLGCYPPTAIVEPTIIVTPTIDPALTTETPVPTTEAPTETEPPPTEDPAATPEPP